MAGIVRLRENHTIEGFAIYSEILIEDRTFRADEWEFDTARVFLTGRCRVFATGHDPYRDRGELVLDRNQENPLVWRTFYRGGAVYFINAPFMEYSGGIGVMMGLLADNRDILHPIIGSKAVMLESFPYISEEGRMIYNRTIFGFMRDIVWPDLIAIALESGLTYTGFASYGVADNPNTSQVMPFFSTHLTRTLRGEMGFTIPSNTRAFYEDITYLNDMTGIPDIRSFLGSQGRNNGIGIATNITSVIVPSDLYGAFNRANYRTVTLPIVSHGVFIEQESFNFLGVLEAFGLSIHSIDMSVTFCESDDYIPWNVYGIDIARYFSYIYRRGHHLPFNTISQTAEKVKNHMNTSFDIRRTETGFDVFMEGNTGEISFFLRTRQSIVEYENCYVEEIEENAFLIRSSGPAFSIRLE
jgi:hypothetical protein